MTDERLAEIERRLADLGDVTSWSSAIDNETGDLLLVLPGQFRYPPLPGQPTGALILENMETSTADDHALMEFLGDAPHAIRDLLDEIAALRTAIADALEPGRYGFELLDAEEMAVVLTETYDPFEEENAHAA